MNVFSSLAKYLSRISGLAQLSSISKPSLSKAYLNVRYTLEDMIGIYQPTSTLKNYANFLIIVL